MTSKCSRVPACRALLPDNRAAPEKPERPAQDELIRNVNEDSKMSAFEALAVETGPLRHLLQRKQMSAFRTIAEVAAGWLKRRN